MNDCLNNSVTVSAKAKSNASSFSKLFDKAEFTAPNCNTVCNMVYNTDTGLCGLTHAINLTGEFNIYDKLPE